MSSTEPRVTPADIEAKFRELQAEADLIEDEMRDYVALVAVVTVIAVVTLAYALGRRRGKRSRTVVEIRRV